MYPWPRLDPHQEDQEVQEQCVEEAYGAGHLVGENQPPLGSKQGVTEVGLVSPTPAGFTPPRAAGGAKGRKDKLPLQSSGWEHGASGMLGNGAPVWPRPESTVNNGTDCPLPAPRARVTQPLHRACEGQRRPWGFRDWAGGQVNRCPEVEAQAQSGGAWWGETHHAERGLVPGAQAQVFPLPLLKGEER